MSNFQTSHQDINQENSIQLIFLLWGHLKSRRKKQSIFLLITIFMSALSEIISLASFLPFLSVLINPDNLWKYSKIRYISNIFGFESSKQLLLPITIIFALTAIISAVIRSFNIWLTFRFAAALGSDFSCDAYMRTLYQPYMVHIKRNSSDVIKTITIQIENTIKIFIQVIQFLTAIVATVGILVYLFILDWQSILIFGTFLIISYTFIIFHSKKKLENNSKDINKKRYMQIKSIQEGIGAIRDILLNDNHNSYISIYTKVDRKLRLKVAQNRFLSTYPRFALESLTLVSISILTFLLVTSRTNFTGIVSLLGVYAFAAQKLLPAFQQIYRTWASIKAESSDLVSVLNLLNQPILTEEINTNIKPFAFNREIVLENISFKYNSNSPLILNDVNLTIKKGEIIGLMGSTGSGKTTLIDILMGLIEPTSGSILIDGVNLDYRNYHELKSWNSIISHVPQEIYLSDNSIIENIAFGIASNEIDIEKVYEASRKAEISKFICNSHDQYDMNVGERGVSLSGGQKQRIGIARALYKEAKILTLDEATSALDNQTESLVMKSIQNIKEDLTIIIVAHRLTTLKKCDRIFKLNEGTLVEIENSF